MKIIVIVIAYKPDINILIENISQYIDFVDKVVIWENSKINDKDAILTINKHKISFLGDGINIGIGAAINRALKKYPNYDYVMTMDQDSIWESFNDYWTSVKIRNSCNEIYGPQIIGEKIESFANQDICVDHVITSGCIMRCSTVERIGCYNEEYFVDAVDEEICYRAKKYGCQIIQIKDGLLKQRYGKPSIRRFLWKKIAVIEYSPIRLYYSARNHIDLIKRYQLSMKVILKLIFKYVVRPLAETLLYHKDKVDKIHLLFKGIYHGLKGKTGELK